MWVVPVPCSFVDWICIAGSFGCRFPVVTSALVVCGSVSYNVAVSVVVDFVVVFLVVTIFVDGGFVVDGFVAEVVVADFFVAKDERAGKLAQ